MGGHRERAVGEVRKKRVLLSVEQEAAQVQGLRAFSLDEYGYRRITLGVDLVMREDDLQGFKRRHFGRC